MCLKKEKIGKMINTQKHRLRIVLKKFYFEFTVNKKQMEPYGN